MRNNHMVSIIPDSKTPDPLPSSSVSSEGLSTFLLGRNNFEISSYRSIFLSIGLHLLIVFLIWLSIIILQFLGINLLTFNPPQHIRDIEFQLVNSPTEMPRNLNTHNRALHNSRAGGKKIPNVREAQTQQQAGRPQQQKKVVPQPVQRPSRTRSVTVQHTQQHKAVTHTHSQPSHNTNPAPPMPRVTAPKHTTSKRHIAAIPNPIAPIHVPDATGPVENTGPVVKGPIGHRGGGGSVAPETLPGQFSGGGSPHMSGGFSGHGGRGQYSQYGSPGGGGGRPGIDALVEPDFGPYLAELQRRIRRNWSPPDDRKDKTVVLLFTIAKDGRLLSIRVKRSSGFENADGAAKMAVERSAPFRPLPREYRHNSISVEFTFDYNVYMGRSNGISGP